MWRVLLRALVLGLSVSAWQAEPSVSGQSATAELPLVFREDFENGAANWEPTDSTAWKVLETKQGKVYSQFQQSKYQPPHRSRWHDRLGA